mgnify:CR=1 FL=1
MKGIVNNMNSFVYVGLFIKAFTGSPTLLKELQSHQIFQFLCTHECIWKSEKSLQIILEHWE